MTAPRRIAVVVPVHDEEELLAECLAALAEACAAAGRAGVPAAVTVVLDSCTDASQAVATAAGVELVVVRARNVGRARAAGCAAALAGSTAADVPRELDWLATTDADSVVPVDWLVRQLEHAEAGADLVVGTVSVADWSAWPPGTAGRYADRYRWGGAGDHPHVHGANLGIRASVYQAVGGFPPLVTGEDRGLVTAAVALGARITRATDLPVRTSSRPSGRAPLGFSQHLHSLTRRSA